MTEDDVFTNAEEIATLLEQAAYDIDDGLEGFREFERYVLSLQDDQFPNMTRDELLDVPYDIDNALSSMDYGTVDIVDNASMVIDEAMSWARDFPQSINDATAFRKHRKVSVKRRVRAAYDDAYIADCVYALLDTVVRANIDVLSAASYLTSDCEELATKLNNAIGSGDVNNIMYVVNPGYTPNKWEKLTSGHLLQRCDDIKNEFRRLEKIIDSYMNLPCFN